MHKNNISISLANFITIFASIFYPLCLRLTQSIPHVNQILFRTKAVEIMSGIFGSNWFNSQGDACVPTISYLLRLVFALALLQPDLCLSWSWYDSGSSNLQQLLFPWCLKGFQINIMEVLSAIITVLLSIHSFLII